MDKLTPAARSINMGKIRSKDTAPEVLVRKLAHKLGYRFRLHRKDLPGKPDLVFPRHRKIIFVHGCFWHQHAKATCKIARVPKSRQDYWLAKLQKNCDRDRSHQEQLRQMGWKTLTIWECETKTPDELEKIVRKFLGR